MEVNTKDVLFGALAIGNFSLFSWMAAAFGNIISAVKKNEQTQQKTALTESIFPCYSLIPDNSILVKNWEKDGKDL